MSRSDFLAFLLFTIVGTASSQGDDLFFNADFNGSGQGTLTGQSLDPDITGGFQFAPSDHSQALKSELFIVPPFVIILGFMAVSREDLRISAICMIVVEPIMIWLIWTDRNRNRTLLRITVDWDIIRPMNSLSEIPKDLVAKRDAGELSEEDFRLVHGGGAVIQEQQRAIARLQTQELPSADEFLARLARRHGRRNPYKLLSDESQEFIFSDSTEHSQEEIQRAVELLETSYFIPPPKCLVYLLYDHMSTGNHNLSGLFDSRDPSVPLKTRGGMTRRIEALNEFLHAGGKEWLHPEKLKEE